MGRKRKEPGTRAEDIRVTVLNLKGSSELKAWLEGASAQLSLTASSFTRLAWAELARRHKIGVPPRS